ncbi:MAG TPA: ABC transporter permease [Terriglobia bacterium]|nr:ABC transporter permease [Terriglobia bacterium]
MIPIRYNLRSLIVRRVGTVMTVLGVALTVAVFVSVLAMVNGLEGTFVDSGEPLNLIMIRQSSQAETNSFFNREIKPIVEATEGVTAVAGEIIVLINHPRMTGETANIIVRGVSDKSLQLRPRLKIVEGRMFRPGLREVIVSRSISRRFRDAKIGDNIKIGRSAWNVVGILDAARTAYDSEIWADYNEISGEFERPIYSSLLVQCADGAAMSAIRERLAGDRRIQLDVFGQKEYFETQAGSALPIKVLGYLIASIMAIGSSFAVMNTMYAATAYRTREIATLRVLGFKRRNITLSFMFESLLLALIGGVVGCLMAMPMNGISSGTSNFNTFSEVAFDFRVTPRLMLEGIVFAAIMGTLGGLLPARLAGRLTIVRALRTEV